MTSHRVGNWLVTAACCLAWGGVAPSGQRRLDDPGRASDLIRSKAYAEAVTALDRVLANDPGNVDALYDKGRALALMGRGAAAVACVRQAIDAGLVDLARLTRDPGIRDLAGDPDFDKILRDYDPVLQEDRAPSLENVKRMLAEPRLQRAVPTYLPRYHAPALTPATLRLLDSPDPRLQRAAVIGLLHQNANEAPVRARVAALLAVPSATIREAAAEYLLWHGTPAERQALADAVATDHDPFVLAAGRAALRLVDTRAPWHGVPAVPLVPSAGAGAETATAPISERSPVTCGEAWAALQAQATPEGLRHAADVYRTAWDMAPRLMYSGTSVDAAALAEQRACLNLTVSIFGFKRGAPPDGPASAPPPPADAFMPPVRDYFDPSRPSVGVPIGSGPFRESVHAGDDVAWNVPDRTVVAVADGVVRLVAHIYSWGFLVVVEHRLPDRRAYCSLYGHLSPSTTVAQGQVVRKGERLGATGRTETWENGGYLAHLHFGIHRGAYLQAPWWAEAPQKPGPSWIAGYVTTARWRNGWHGWVDPQRFIRDRR
jgi:murein DD-endopeptidase MepM/ murein hydrolase activator NlpD